MPAAVHGADVSGGRQLGDAPGSETHVLSVEELATHTHAIAASSTGVTTDASGSHTHTATTDAAGAHTHTVGQTVIQNGLSTRVDADNEGSPGEINLDGAQTTTTSTAGSHSSLRLD